MNERIWELWHQATLDPNNEDSNDLIRRFAELIVRECVGIVENLSPGYKDYRDQIENAFRRDCVEKMKEQFGVKS